MAEKKTTRRAARPSATAVEESTKNGKEATPKVKKPAEKAPPAPVKKPAAVEKKAAAPAPKVVELLEGASYEVAGFTFYKGRPVPVSDPKILAEVEVNSRFKVAGAGGGTT